MDKQEEVIWKEALNYAFNQIQNNPWPAEEKPRKYAIEHNNIFYPNKYIIRNCLQYIEENYPEFNPFVPTTANNGKRLNAFLESKGAKAITIGSAYESENYVTKKKVL